MSAIIDNFASRTFASHWNELEPSLYNTVCYCGAVIKRGDLARIEYQVVDNGFADVNELVAIHCFKCQCQMEGA